MLGNIEPVSGVGVSGNQAKEEREGTVWGKGGTDQKSR